MTVRKRASRGRISSGCATSSPRRDDRNPIFRSGNCRWCTDSSPRMARLFPYSSLSARSSAFSFFVCALSSPRRRGSRSFCTDSASPFAATCPANAEFRPRENHGQRALKRLRRACQLDPIQVPCAPSRSSKTSEPFSDRHQRRSIGRNSRGNGNSLITVIFS